MSELPKVPEHLSPEGRATMIADQCARIEDAGNPVSRRRRVSDHALAHIRAALAQAGLVKVDGQ